MRAHTACWDFEARHERPPAADDGPALAELAEAIVQASPNKALARVACKDLALSYMADGDAMGELAPVAAVMGGVAANNVVRAVSHVGPPLQNLFCFCLFDGMGAVQALR